MSRSAATIYAGGPIMAGYTGTPANSSQLMSALAASGFTTVIGFTIWIEAAGGDSTSKDGDLSFNHLPVDGPGSSVIFVSEGQYLGPSDWASQLTTLKTSGSVEKIMFSTLGKFSRLKGLIEKYGTGTESPLHKNFLALKNALPIDGIDIDDEDLWDAATTKCFCQMLNAIGLEVTFCPYSQEYASYWAGLLADLNTSETPNLVTAFNLQCYDGGAYPDFPVYVEAVYEAMKPSGWTKEQAQAFIYPGFWCYHCEGAVPAGEGRNNACPAAVSQQLATWQKAGYDDIQGAFIYILDSVVNFTSSGKCEGADMDLAAYAKSIRST